ncbi:MAG: response regulator [Clostridia bacterium]|nr:response regulator [Clostridia bacterium]
MLKVILVDDELPALEETNYLLGKYSTLEVTGMYQSAEEAMQALSEQKAGAVFLDIDMPGVNGLELAMKIQELYAGILIVFITAFSEYALEAFRVYPVDYILKPVNEKRLELTVRHLLEQSALRKMLLQESTKTYIHCFGSFEVYSESSEKLQMKFATRQAKQMFAYLVAHLEKPVSRQELIDNIFGGDYDSKTVNLLHVTAYKLRIALEEIGASRSSITIRGNYILETAGGVCDYIDFTHFVRENAYISDDNIGQAEQIASLYKGTFLEDEDYLWADEISAQLETQYEELVLSMARYYLQRHKNQKCEKLLVNLVRYNPLSEEGNTTMLDLYMATRETDKFARQFRAYRKLLGEELDAAPDARYTAYYESNCE